MASKSTTKTLDCFGQLDLRDHRWARVDIGDLGGMDPHSVLTGMVRLPDLRGKVDAGGRLGDLVGTYWAALFIMAPRFISVLMNEGLTGWAGIPVSIDSERDIGEASLLTVHGSCGPIRETGRGRVLKLASWDGSDLFVPRNESTILLSPRATEAIREGGLLNVGIERPAVEPA